MPVSLIDISFYALISFKFQRIIFFASLQVNRHLFENPCPMFNLVLVCVCVIFVYITCYPGEDYIAICIFVTKTKTETKNKTVYLPFIKKNFYLNSCNKLKSRVMRTCFKNFRAKN